MTRRRSSGAMAVLVAIGLLLASACSATSSDEAEAKDSIRIGVVNSVSTLDPHATNTVSPDQSVLASIYSSLVDVVEGKIVPQLATEWSTTDNTTWTFTLNPDAVFGDDTPVDAEAVKWNFDRIMAPGTTLRVAGSFTNVGQVDAPDATTVVITLKQPDGEFPYQVARLPIMDGAFVEAHDPTNEAMGSGPYELVSYDPGGNVVLKAKEDYWGTPAAIKNVTFVALGGYDATMSAALAGEIDVMADLTPADVSRVDGADGLEVRSASSNRVGFLDLNTTKEPLTDVRVRQALNYAVDKDAIIKAVLGDTVKASPSQVINEMYAGFNSDLQPYPYDPDKARELLTEAGYPDGFTLKVDNATDRYVASDEILQAMAAQFEEVGVHLKINDIPFDNFMDKFVGENADMEQSIYLTQASSSTGQLLGLFDSSSIYSYWDDPKYTELLNAARYATDNSDVPGLYKDVTDYMAEQAPVVFLFTQPALYAVSKDVVWTPRFNGYLLPADMSFD